MTELEEFQQFVSLQAAQVKSNVEVVTPESLGQEFFLHIAPAAPVWFIPRMPYAAALSENITTPRITVSDHLLGCMNGYARVVKDFHSTDLKHVYKLNMFLFRYALKPSPKLVFDADFSNEHWLVTYNTATRRYKAVEIGEVKTVAMNYTTGDKNEVYGVVTFYVYIATSVDVRLTPNLTVSKGYYRFTTYSKSTSGGGIHNLHPEKGEVEPISKSEYDSS